MNNYSFKLIEIAELSIKYASAIIYYKLRPRSNMDNSQAEMKIDIGNSNWIQYENKHSCYWSLSGGNNF